MEEYKAENFQEAVENIDNSEFVKAIERMRADYTDDNKNDVMNRAVFDVTYFVPAFRNDNAQLTQGKDNRLSFNENQQARFVLVENPQGEKYIPAFTDHEALLKFRNEQAQGAQGFIMTFPDLASVIEAFPNVEGFVINPFTHNLPFAKAFVAEIKKNIIAQMEKIEAEQKKANITMTTNENK